MTQHVSPSDRGPRTHAQINDERRAALLDGAIRSVATHGIAGTTVKTIAAAAGVSTGLVAHYYGSKGDMLLAGYRHLCQVFSLEMSKAAQGPTGPSQQVRALVDACFCPPVYDPVQVASFLEFWREARHNAAMETVNHEAYARFRRGLTVLLKRAFDEVGTNHDPQGFAAALIAMIDGFWVHLSTEPCVSTEAAGAACQAMLDTILRPHRD